MNRNYLGQHRTEVLWNTSRVNRLAAVVCGISLVLVSVVGVAASPKQQPATVPQVTPVVNDPAPLRAQGPVIQIAQRTPLVTEDDLAALYEQIDMSLHTAQEAESRVDELNIEIAELRAQVNDANVQLFNVTNDLISATEQIALLNEQLSALTERILALEEDTPVEEPTPPVESTGPTSDDVEVSE